MNHTYISILFPIVPNLEDIILFDCKKFLLL